MTEPSEINSPGNPFFNIWWFLIWSSTTDLLAKTWSVPVRYPVDFWIKYLNHVLPDPGNENKPVLGPGGSSSLNEFPEHQEIVLFFANEKPD